VAENDQVVDRGDDFVPTEPENTTPKVEQALKEDHAPAKVEEKTPEAEPERDDKGKFIPKARFDEAVQKERDKAAAIAARNAELESHLAAQTTSQDIEAAQKIVKDLIKQRNSHLGDGELEKAGQIDEKIFELQEAIAERKAEIKAEQSKAQAVETMKYDSIVERLEADHPEIDPDNEEMYDEEVVAELRALMIGYQQSQRLSPAQALQKAAKKVFGGLKVPPKEDKAAEEGMRRKSEAVEKNLEASRKQPASTKDVGLDHDKKGGGLDAKSVLNMKYDEFVKLGDDVLSRLRGDTL
jgi:hypothetical protein